MKNRRALKFFKTQSVAFTKKLDKTEKTQVITLANTYIHIHCMCVHMYAYIYTH